MLNARYARERLRERLGLSYSGKNYLAGAVPLGSGNSAAELLDKTSDSNSERSILECCPLETDGKGNFIDTQGRKVILKGINVDGALKFPFSPNLPSYSGNADDPTNIFYDGENLTFVGRPFPLEEAEEHFQRIKSWGYNTLRYLITWEALEHGGPGQYDEEFIDYTLEIVRIIHRVGGLYIFFETHQDVWSRFCGGSGAPMWTFYAAGLQPRRFVATEAAILHNESRFHHHENPEKYRKMLWTSNYKRLASLVMFTLFFSGDNYFPSCKINGENIQDYLQRHYFQCVERFWQRVVEGVPEMIRDGTILGFELLNEPNRGLMGHEDINYLPGNQQLRVGTTPTIYQTMKLGMGFACEVDVYKITVIGPQKHGVTLIDPKGTKAWLTAEEAKAIDEKYGWKRDPSWVMGECLFAQHGIWTWSKNVNFSRLPELSPEKRLIIANLECNLAKPNYFNHFHLGHNFDSSKVKHIDLEYFINNNFVDFYVKFKETIRKISSDVFVLIQPPVLEVPPKLRADPRHIIDSKTVYTPHYYDGMSLMFKSWNTKYNVDTFGIMRGKYYNPIFGIVIGERAIRNCLKKQFQEMRKECEDYLGTIPVLMSETGMPFDMDNKKAYKDGRYTSQTSALDALCNALEGANMSHTYWCYTSVNTHERGDAWNNEDFSFWSKDDKNHNYDEECLICPSRASTVRCLVSSVLHHTLKGASYPSETPSPSPSKTRHRTHTSRTSSATIRNGVSTLSIDAKNSSSDSSCQTNDKNCNGTSHLTNGDSPKMKNASSVDEPIKEYSNKNGEAIEEHLADVSDCLTYQASSLLTMSNDTLRLRYLRRCYPSPDGVRAVSAIIRPYVVATKGQVTFTEFDIKFCKFSISLRIDASDDDIKHVPTVIYVPKWHYPNLSLSEISLSSGSVKFNESLDYLEWYHDKRRPPWTIGSSFLTHTKEESLIIKGSSCAMDDASIRSRVSTHEDR